MKGAIVWCVSLPMVVLICKALSRPLDQVPVIQGRVPGGEGEMKSPRRPPPSRFCMCAPLTWVPL